MLIAEAGIEYPKGGEFTAQALGLLLDRTDIKKKGSKLRVFDVLAAALKQDESLKKQQLSALKDLTKFLYPILKDDEDDRSNKGTWIPLELENSAKYRAKLYANAKEIPHTRTVKGKDGNYTVTTDVICTRHLRISSPEQVIYWLEDKLKVKNDTPDTSWYLSAETCTILLWFLATNPQMSFSCEEMLENLATPGKGSGSSKGYKKAESLEAKLAAANKKIAELEEKLKEKEKDFSEYTLALKEEAEQQEKAHSKSCSAWAHLLEYFKLALVQQEVTIAEQKEKIAEQALKLGVYSSEEKLILDNAPDLKEFWDLVVHTFKQEMVNPSKCLYSVREFIEASSRLVVKKGSYRKVRILEVEGFEPMPLDEDDIKTVGKPMGSIFRCLLNKAPKTSGANLYPESYARLCQWFAFKCSRYNPKQWFPSSDKFRFSVETGELGKYNIPKRNYLSNEELINLPALGAAAA